MKDKNILIYRVAIALMIAIIMLTAVLAIASCSVCPNEKDVMSGKAVEKHYRHHKFTAYRATYEKHGNFYVITYKNMQTELPKVTVSCKPPFRSGSWVNL